MGLLDVLNGMKNGPHGQPGVTTSSGGGMSPITMAILALLAYKGIKKFSTPQASPGTNPASFPNSEASNPNGGLGGLLGSGGLGGLLKGGLGGLLGGPAAGSVLSGGLGDLLRQFQQNGQGDVANSWVGKGPNQNISENELANTIGDADIDALSQHTGLPRDELLAALRRELPKAVDELTPDGRVPSGAEMSQRI
jgi:uncharacterized protein YidB (DUF937 family)